MTDEKRKYCMETIIPNIRKEGVSLEELSAEIDYRDRNGILESKEGFDDRLYFYSTEELADAEELWTEVYSSH